MPDLAKLVSIFYDDAAQLGVFTPVAAEALPANARRLLAHQEHMTVTVEAFHGCAVDVEVLAVAESQGHYARKILLRRKTDRAVVQFGIVRMNFAFVNPAVRADIESRRIPLGRVLIEHNVLRQVQLVGLWRVQPGPDLQQLFQIAADHEVFGRTALIFCDGEPAVELLEIVV
jgi:chorismate-pyruvate lyase